MGLLSAQSLSGDSGLWRALQNGHDETVEAFAEILKANAPRLTPEQLLNVLQIVASDGFPALYTALFMGDAKWIEAYGKVLEKVGESVPSEQLAKVLDTENEDVRELLKFAHETGHVEALAAFETLKAKFAPRA